MRKVKTLNFLKTCFTQCSKCNQRWWRPWKLTLSIPIHEKKHFKHLQNISASNKKTLDDVVIVFRRKYVKPVSQATAKHNWHKLTFDPNTNSLSDFPEELHECAERAFGDNAQHMIDSSLHAKVPPHLKRSLNLFYLEYGTYDQVVAHLEKDIKFSDLENNGELTRPTMTAIPPKNNPQNTIQTKIVCHFCKKPGHVIRDCRKRIKKEQEQSKIPRSQTWTLRHLNHSHPVLIANGQIILQKIVGAFPMPLIHPNGSNKVIQQTIELMGKNKETRPIQVLYQFSKPFKVKTRQL